MSEQPEKRRGLPSRVKMRHDTHFVDELTTRHQDPIGQTAPIASLQPDPNQPRSTMGDLEDLAGSIAERGILEPILVRPITGQGAVQHRIISGERRFRAAQQAGLTEVPIIIFEVDEDEALEIALIENLQRKDLTPFEEADGYRALADRHQYTHQEIASAVGRSRSLVSETLKLLEMPAAVRQAADSLGIDSRSLLLEIAKAAGGDEEAMLGLLEQAAGGGLTRDDVRTESKRQKPRTEARRKPYVFKFRAPDKTFNLALSFRRSEVDRGDLIDALETILGELKTAAADDPSTAPSPASSSPKTPESSEEE